MTDYYIDEDGWKIPTNGDNAPSSAYKIIETSLRLSIPPVFSNDPKSGATEMLDSLVMRWDRLSYCSLSNPSSLDTFQLWVQFYSHT